MILTHKAPTIEDGAPAQLMTTSTLSYVSTTRSTRRCTAAGSVMSVGTPSAAFSRAPLAAASSSAALATRVGSRAAMTTLYPSRAKRDAVARPMPCNRCGVLSVETPASCLHAAR